ncbi:OsmC family protein [Candidatus Kapaibacterium sp.]
MNVELKLKSNNTILAADEQGIITILDAMPDHGGEGNGSSPMTIMLEAMASCSFLDVLAILRKKRKQIKSMRINVSGIRSDDHPKVFTDVKLHYILESPDASIADLERAIELSQTKYCGASAMFQRSGCNVTWDSEIIS